MIEGSSLLRWAFFTQVPTEQRLWTLGTSGGHSWFSAPMATAIVPLLRVKYLPSERTMSVGQKWQPVIGVQYLWRTYLPYLRSLIVIVVFFQYAFLVTVLSTYEPSIHPSIHSSSTHWVGTIDRFFPAVIGVSCDNELYVTSKKISPLKGAFLTLRAQSRNFIAPGAN